MGSGARIAIAERWSVLRRGLTDVLQTRWSVVADVEDLGDLGRALPAQAVDLVVLGGEPGLDLASVVSRLTGPAFAVPVVALCDDVDAESLRAVLRAGARAVVSKKVDDRGLLDAVERVLAGERVVDQAFLPLLFGATELGEAPVQDGLLTPREREVLAELARGASNRDIASALLMGESTVKTHLGRIYSKLEVSGRHHAVGRALELGLLT
jgi:DNA-binding NarL/FixJ family response regulator